MSKIAVINGANRGLGLALTYELLAAGYKVWALCRQSSAELAGTKAKIVEDTEVTSLASAAKAVAQVTDNSIDLLIAVAGISRQDSLRQLDSTAFNEIEEQFKVNALGPLQLTSAFLPKMAPKSKVVFLTSRMGSIGDNSSGSRYGYRASKAALNAFAKSLSLDLKDQVSIGILHPGFVQTGMTNGRGDMTASQSARLLMARIQDLGPHNSGQFLHANGEVLPW